MYPFAHSWGRSSLYYGEVNQKCGVFHCTDGYVILERMMYIAPSLRDLLEQGVGIGTLIECES